jgi:xylan 1,4-beta-xylosidase
MGSPQSPSAEQFAELEAAGQLQLLDSPHYVEVEKGVVTLKLSLPRQSVSLLTFRAIPPA